MAVSMEELTEAVRLMGENQTAMQTQIATLTAENAYLRSEALSSLPSLVEAVRQSATRESSRSQQLVDTRGIGKPSVFSGDEVKFREWSKKVESFVTGVFGEQVRAALEWAAEHGTAISRDDLNTAFGEGSDEEIENIHGIGSQLYTALQQLTTGEPFDLVTNVSADSHGGFECWRKLFRRYDPATGSRKRNLLRAILNPGRASMNELQAAMERWEEMAMRYERRRDENGNREQLTESIRMAALESLLPEELENHVQLNMSRLTDYETLRREITQYLEVRTGARIRDAPVNVAPTGGGRKKSPDDMDIGSMQQKGKGGKHGKGSKGKSGKGAGKSGKGPGPHVKCWDCGGNHYQKDCPKQYHGHSHKGGGKGKHAKGGKSATHDKGKGKGSKPAVGSLENGENAQPEPEDAGYLELFAMQSASAAPVVEDGWLKLNFDSGAAATVMPSSWAKAQGAPSGKQFRTATGQVIDDEGYGEVLGRDEYNRPAKFKARRAQVRKPLVSAASMLSNKVSFMDKDGGIIFPEGSDAGWRLRSFVQRLRSDHPNDGVGLWQERGVYNMYMKLSDEQAEKIGSAVDKVEIGAADVEPVPPAPGAAASSGGLRPADRP